MQEFFFMRYFYVQIYTIVKLLINNAVYMSSCCWNVTRYADQIKSGPEALRKHKENSSILHLIMLLMYVQMYDYVYGCVYMYA